MQIEIRGAQKLSFREKQVVTLKETGVAAKSIALRLKMSESSVATLYQRARAKGYETVIVIDGDALGLMEDDEMEDSDGEQQPEKKID